MTQDSEQYQVPITRRVMRHVEYSRAGDHVVFRQIDDAGNAQQICMPRDQAELLVQWMLDDLFPDDGDPDPDGGESMPAMDDKNKPKVVSGTRRKKSVFQMIQEAS